MEEKAACVVEAEREETCALEVDEKRACVLDVERRCECSFARVQINAKKIKKYETKEEGITVWR